MALTAGSRKTIRAAVAALASVSAAASFMVWAGDASATPVATSSLAAWGVQLNYPSYQFAQSPTPSVSGANQSASGQIVDSQAVIAQGGTAVVSTSSTATSTVSTATLSNVSWQGNNHTFTATSITTTETCTSAGCTPTVAIIGGVIDKDYGSNLKQTVPTNPSAGQSMTSGAIDGQVAVFTFNVQTLASGVASVTAVHIDDYVGNSLSSGVQGTTDYGFAQGATLAAPAPTKLLITSTALSGAASAGATAGQVTVTSTDGSGNAAPVTSNTMVNLSSSSSYGVFSLTPGGAPITSVTIPSGSSSVSFYYGDATAGKPTITAAATGLISATQQEMITTGTIALTVNGASNYGAQPAFTVTAAGTVPPGVTVGSTACLADADGDTIGPDLAPGTHALDPDFCNGVTLTGPNASSYNTSLSGGTYVVLAGTVTVTVGGFGFYGSAPTFTTSVTPPDGVTVTGAVTCTAATDGTTLGSSIPPGSYTVDPTTCSGLTLTGDNAADYTVAYAGGSYNGNAGKYVVTVTGSAAYGSSPSFSVLSVTGGDDSVTADASSLTCTGTTAGAIDGLAPGSYAVDPNTCSGVTISGSDAADYTVYYSGAGFTVAPGSVPVTVTGTGTYGSSPTFTYAVAGGVSGTVTCGSVLVDSSDVTADGTLGAGTYSVDPATCSGLTLSADLAGDYAITYSGTVTVQPKSLTPTVSFSGTYGQTPTLSFSGLPAGLSLAGCFEATSGDQNYPLDGNLPVGRYSVITCDGSLPTPSGTGAGNYTIAGLNYGTSTISPAKLAVGVVGQQTYGGVPTFRATATSLPAGLSVSGSPSCGVLTNGTSVAPGVAAGTYELRASSCSGLTLSGDGASNYRLVYKGLSFQVGRAALTVTVNRASRAYGQADPVFGYTATGFVLGQTSAVLKGTFSATASITVGGVQYSSSLTSPRGNYYTRGSGLSSPNYTINYVHGLMTVGKATVRVSVVPVTVSQGQAPQFALQVSGLVGADQLVGTASFATQITRGTKHYSYDPSNPSSPTGLYYVYVGGLTVPNSNYTLVTTPGKLYVTAGV